MGAKTCFVISGDGDTRFLTADVGAPDRGATEALVDRLYPGRRSASYPVMATVDGGVYPPEGTVAAGVFPSISFLGDASLAVDRPSQLPARVRAALGRRNQCLHAMHSVVHWLAFAVWKDGQLVRSLSLSPDDGVIESIGEPLKFELPFWEGKHRVDDEYPLPFHPLEMGEAALAALCGFVLEGRPRPQLVDPDRVQLYRFKLHGPSPA
jgi:hypothetical protein